MKQIELLHKQQHTQREKREAEQNRRILQKTSYALNTLSLQVFQHLVLVVVILDRQNG